jgi:hypothetical protein
MGAHASREEGAAGAQAVERAPWDGREPEVGRVLLALPVRLLRNESHAKEKNREMMRRLWQCVWFVEYRQSLDLYRAGKRGRPVYPTEQVDVIERAVDNWMRKRYPGYVR